MKSVTFTSAFLLFSTVLAGPLSVLERRNAEGEGNYASPPASQITHAAERREEDDINVNSNYYQPTTTVTVTKPAA